MAFIIKYISSKIPPRSFGAILTVFSSSSIVQPSCNYSSSQSVTIATPPILAPTAPVSQEAPLMATPWQATCPNKAVPAAQRWHRNKRSCDNCQSINPAFLPPASSPLEIANTSASLPGSLITRGSLPQGSMPIGSSAPAAFNPSFQYNPPLMPAHPPGMAAASFAPIGSQLAAPF